MPWIATFDQLLSGITNLIPAVLIAGMIGRGVEVYGVGFNAFLLSTAFGTAVLGERALVDPEKYTAPSFLLRHSILLGLAVGGLVGLFSSIVLGFSTFLAGLVLVSGVLGAVNAVGRLYMYRINGVRLLLIADALWLIMVGVGSLTLRAQPSEYIYALWVLAGLVLFVSLFMAIEHVRDLGPTSLLNRHVDWAYSRPMLTEFMLNAGMSLMVTLTIPVLVDATALGHYLTAGALLGAAGAARSALTNLFVAGGSSTDTVLESSTESHYLRSVWLVILLLNTFSLVVLLLCSPFMDRVMGVDWSPVRDILPLVALSATLTGSAAAVSSLLRRRRRPDLLARGRLLLLPVGIMAPLIGAIAFGLTGFVLGRIAFGVSELAVWLTLARRDLRVGVLDPKAHTGGF